MKNAAIICAEGIGDGLLMMIVAHHLKKAEYQVTIFHNKAHELTPLFEGHHFVPCPPLMSFEEELKPFSLVIVENDNSEQAWFLFALRDQKRLNNLLFFFPTPCNKKNPKDFLFNPKKSVASNIVNGCVFALNLKETTKENGITLSKHLKYRHFQTRIAIHPTSNDPKRNWKPSQYLHLADKLKKRGWEVSFIVSSKERIGWLHVLSKGFFLPKFISLKEIADYLYESAFLIGNDSGLGHLASNLKIPVLTISGNPKRVRLWRPDFYLGNVATIPFPLPNFKGIHFRFRETHWQHFIPVWRTLKAFHQLKEKV